MRRFPQILRTFWRARGGAFWRARGGAFWRARGGLAAIEFALILPIAIAMLFGEFVLGEALSINRKVSIASRTIADLVARKSSLTSANLSTILTASTQIAAPYSNGMTVVVAEVTTDANLVTTVTWNQALNTTGLTNGAVVALPAGMAQANTSLIYARVVYAYTPLDGKTMFGTIPISNTFYMPPRTSATVTCIGC
ncbi:hypothetical protein CCR94_12530 [Rhodoblastus sphagnicola]|uniref:TadE-like domain-containing protein n=1 Tax=Rhodoblastus sphagnicola TaxID=333368 RepID=A0A2S6N769_9HYPH|nr:TadE/TadG family type IV pilus assembly protein [Rhodoblastus sphagnicola]MBB4197431.1 Flp pilus assembly protein TadG [Rhodoblastus sphagnicola]PPQ30458.1 hypothetical protein CCR94_12530 [Rhodoblastus sphagnicola]